jgi:hypothetical protein
MQVNTKLIDSLAQIILSLTEEERQLLEQKMRHFRQKDELQQKREALQRDLAIGLEQLENGEYTEYDDSSLPSLLETIRQHGRQRLERTE